MRHPAPPQMTFDGFSLDFERETVIRDEQVLTLRRQSFEVLRLLVERRGRIVSKEELFNAVWGDAVVTDDSLTQCLVEIRKALGDQGRTVIKTVSRRGYIFAAEPVLAATQGLKETPRSQRWILWLAAGVFSALALLVIIKQRPANMLHSIPEELVIAVMPFEDFTPEGNNRYLARGISEEILNRLTLLPGLKVISRTSSFSARFDGEATAADIAAELGATLMIEGSVREQDGELRITVQLVETARGYHLWSQNFNRSDADVLRVQDQVAHTVADLLDLKYLKPDTSQQMLSAEDYDLYLRGTQAARSANFSRLNDADHYLNSVLKRNPDHLPSARRLAHVYLLQMQVGDLPIERGALLVSQLAAVMQTQADGQAASDAVFGELALRIENNLEAAATHLDRALASDPDNYHTRYLAGELAYSLRRYTQAVNLYRGAISGDPLCSYCYYKLAQTYLASGDLKQAEQSVRKFMQMTQGGHFTLAKIRTLGGDYAAAAKILARPVPLEMQKYTEFYELILKKNQGKTDFDASFSHFIARYGDQEHTRIGQLYAYNGDAHNAVAWLRMVRDSDLVQLLESLPSPLYDPVRGMPDWHEFVSELGRNPEQLSVIPFTAGLVLPRNASRKPAQ
jgi:TolB-like protein/DNA-binding winged helix-turn-helix (wHTH) protein/lipopolysaccharide biosynthesis regulator YciM